MTEGGDRLTVCVSCKTSKHVDASNAPWYRCALHGAYYRRACVTCGGPAVHEPTGPGGPAYCQVHDSERAALVVGAGAVVPVVSGELSDGLRALLERSNAPATVRTYRKAWARWEGWAVATGRPSFPARPVDVAEYVAALAAGTARPGSGRPVGVASLRQAVAAINAAHMAAGLDPPGRALVVSKAVRGAARGGAVAGRGQARPLRARELRGLLDALPGGPRGVRDRALLLVGWLGGLRRSELAALTVADVSVVEQGVELRILRSKTNQSGPARFVGVSRQRPPYCPAAAVVEWRAWLARRGVTDGPQWRSIVAGEPGPGFTGRSVYGRVVAAAKRAGFTHTIGAHSMRAGVITEGSVQGAPADQLRDHARHASIDQTLEYVRAGDVWSRNPTFGLL